MKVDRAKISDAAAIQKLINGFADQDCMLPRALSDIYENIREYLVVRDNEQVIGCAALHVNWLDLAEIRSLAVDQRKQNQGIGSLLVQACLNEAKELALPTVFCLTLIPTFFEKYSFHLVDKMELPRKIWTDCYHCPKFPNCDAVALIHHI